MICKKCNKEIVGKKAGPHKRWCGHESKKYLKIKRTCKLCKKDFLTSYNRPSKTCSLSCSSKLSMTDEVKEKISKSRKIFLKKNPDKHTWKKKNKHTSDPCERFKAFLRKNDVSFQSEVQPLRERFFSIDIAFPEEKIGIEINGNQHYNSDKSLKQYYQNRHDLIEESGWKIFEIHYSQCFSDEKMMRILTHIRNNAQLDFVYEFEIVRKKNRENKYGSWEDAGLARRLKWESSQQQYIDKIKNSGIDYSKFGWVGQVSSIIGQKPQKVKKWMLRIMPEFYHQKCFKRKTTK